MSLKSYRKKSLFFKTHLNAPIAKKDTHTHTDGFIFIDYHANSNQIEFSFVFDKIPSFYNLFGFEILYKMIYTDARQAVKI